MIETRSEVIDKENCHVTMTIDGRVRDLEIEGAIIIKKLVTRISECTGTDQKIVLAYFIKKLVEQFEGVEYEINRYRKR